MAHENDTPAGTEPKRDGGPSQRKNMATGQKSSAERGAHTRSKKNPGKRPHKGGSSR